MVNVLKFRTLYSKHFWPNFCFLCSCCNLLSPDHQLAAHPTEPLRPTAECGVWWVSSLFAIHTAAFQTPVIKWIWWHYRTSMVRKDKDSMVRKDKSMQFKWVPTTYALVDAIQMSAHNICLYKEVDKKYTGCNLKTMELLDCALIGICAVIRLNTVYSFRAPPLSVHLSYLQEVLTWRLGWYVRRPSSNKVTYFFFHSLFNPWLFLYK